MNLEEEGLVIMRELIAEALIESLDQYIDDIARLFKQKVQQAILAAKSREDGSKSGDQL